jgi:RES domain-containing protein
VISAWRITKRRQATAAFTGEGGLSSSGRWHPKGMRVIYTASSLALASLEVFAHLQRAHRAIRWAAFRVKIPEDTITALARDHLPRHWRREPPGAVTQRLGAAWLAAGQSAVLRVPSAIVPADSNYLINPLHPDFEKLVIGPAEPFHFDPRLWK